MDFYNRITQEDLLIFLYIYHPELNAEILDFNLNGEKGTAELFICNQNKTATVNAEFNNFKFSFGKKTANRDWQKFMFAKFKNEYAKELNAHIDSLIAAEYSKIRETGEKKINRNIKVAEAQIKLLQKFVERQKEKLEKLLDNKNLPKNTMVQDLEKQKIKVKETEKQK